MYRVVVMACAALACLLLGACDSGTYYDDRYGSGYYGQCDRAPTCEACTPIVGCGWCSYGDGRGICLSEPNACRVQQFSWTWEPTGCSALTDGGVAGGDGAADASTPDAAEASTPDETSDATPSDDGAADGSSDDGSDGI